MAFLNNSGDIILDAVLTERGRQRLAAGDGSFRIAKFAFGDDEIDYNLYTPVTSSGYQDLRILKLPIFEAFTENSAGLRSKLLTYTDSNLLYLPVIKLNNLTRFGAATAVSPGPVSGYYVSVDQASTTAIGDNQSGYRYADANSLASDLSQIVFDQGLDSTDLTLGYLANRDAEMLETEYLIECDNRLLMIANPAGGNNLASPSFIDDDSIASYFLNMQSDGSYFAAQPAGAQARNANGQVTANQSVPYIISDPGPNAVQEGSMIGSTSRGRLGSRLALRLKSSENLETGITLFTQLGGTVTISAVNYYFIDTVIRVTGVTTGYRVDVPLKLLKKV
tara:strand:+ start:2173 stop:3180 length:1008 start_codon:yes stop_codon:yes gene_type:complete